MLWGSPALIKSCPSALRPRASSALFSVVLGSIHCEVRACVWLFARTFAPKDMNRGTQRGSLPRHHLVKIQNLCCRALLEKFYCQNLLNHKAAFFVCVCVLINGLVYMHVCCMCYSTCLMKADKIFSKWA